MFVAYRLIYFCKYKHPAITSHFAVNIIMHSGNWFYRAEENTTLKTIEKSFNKWFCAVVCEFLLYNCFCPECFPSLLWNQGKVIHNCLHWLAIYQGTRSSHSLLDIIFQFRPVKMKEISLSWSLLQYFCLCQKNWSNSRIACVTFN